MQARDRKQQASKSIFNLSPLVCSQEDFFASNGRAPL